MEDEGTNVVKQGFCRMFAMFRVHGFLVDSHVRRQEESNRQEGDTCKISMDQTCRRHKQHSINLYSTDQVPVD